MGNLLDGRRVNRRVVLKSLALAGLAIGGAALTTACAGQQGPAAQPKGEESTKPDVDKAKAEGVVQLYTSLDTAILAGIIDPFKAKYGIDVKVYRAGAREVTSKIFTEYDAKQHICDTLDASDVQAFNEMKERGMLAKYFPAHYDAYPAALKDPDGYWTADRLTQIIIGYNTNIYKGADIPTGYADLVDPRFKDKMCMQEPVAFTARIFTVAENMGWDWLAKIGQNRPKFVQSVQVMGQMVETGEIPISIFQNDNIVARARDQGRPTDLVFPKEGVCTEPGAIGVMKESAHPHAARLLVDWWLGKEGQEANAAGYKYSPRPDINPPKGCPPLSELKIWHQDAAYIKAHLQEINDKIEKALKP